MAIRLDSSVSAHNIPLLVACVCDDVIDAVFTFFPTLSSVGMDVMISEGVVAAVDVDADALIASLFNNKNNERADDGAATISFLRFSSIKVAESSLSLK